MNKLLAMMIASMFVTGAALAKNNLVMDNVTGNKYVNNAYTSTPGAAANAAHNLAYMQTTSAYRPAQTTYNNQMNYLRSSSMEQQVTKGYQIFGGGAVKTR